MKQDLREIREFTNKLDAAGLEACGISVDDFTEAQRYVYDIRYKKEQKAWVELISDRDKRIRKEAIAAFKKELEGELLGTIAAPNEFLNRELEDGWNACIHKVVDILKSKD